MKESFKKIFSQISEKTLCNSARPVDAEPSICYNGNEPCIQKNGGKYLCCNP